MYNRLIYAASAYKNEHINLILFLTKRVSITEFHEGKCVSDCRRMLHFAAVKWLNYSYAT